MAIRVVRLGGPRAPGEGLRIGTVRHPPRGVPRARLARDGWYDVWLPVLAPAAETVRLAQAAGTDAAWARFARRYRAEMKAPGPRHVLALLVALSRSADFAVGCYCENETRCHRSLLRGLLAEAGAELAPGPWRATAPGPSPASVRPRPRRPGGGTAPSPLPRGRPAGRGRPPTG